MNVQTIQTEDELCCLLTSHPSLRMKATGSEDPAYFFWVRLRSPIQSHEELAVQVCELSFAERFDSVLHKLTFCGVANSLSQAWVFDESASAPLGLLYQANLL